MTDYAWPDTPEGWRRYIATAERFVRQNNWHWQQRRAQKPWDELCAFNEPSCAPRQEDAVFLGEVIEQLARQMGEPETRAFIQNVTLDGRAGNQRVGQRKETRTAVERMRLARHRAKLRQWAEENG